MPSTLETHEPEAVLSDYSLVGQNASRAVEKGLAEAEWYQCPVPRETMRELLERRDAPAFRDAVLWLALLGLSGWFAYVLWPSWLAIFPFGIYWMLYGSTSDARWHEYGHGTVFKTDWINNLLYELGSFMVMRESTVWRWSHTRHHSDTIVVGRDPEIAVPRPPNLLHLLLSFVGVLAAKDYFKKVLLHATGRLRPDEATYIPEAERAKVYLKARIHLLVYVVVVGMCICFRSILPLLYVGLPNILGSWLMPVYGFTQHAGLAENVLDHRLNCRTVRMNIVHRFLYLNMNYHVEHHMFPQIPYYNLPRLHEVVKDDMPKPYTSILHAWREIIPAVLRQRRDPGHYVKRQLPSPSTRADATPAARTIESTATADAEGWVEVGQPALLDREDVLRFDHGSKTYAIYRTADNKYYATDGICTHGNTHLASGIVMGNQVECPKHNGRFDVRDGAPKRVPACVGLRTYPVRVAGGTLAINVAKAGGAGACLEEQLHTLRVVSNANIATFIKELVLEPTSRLTFQPGQYLQLMIPAYGEIKFDQFQVEAPYDAVWRAQHVYDYRAENQLERRRNYSMATNPATEPQLRFNVRIATPPVGQDCLAGAGSSYVWSLRTGDTVTAVGPVGDFLIKESEREMVYLGGGSGMAPLRSHLASLFETQKTRRRVSYWYGARTRQELFYDDYFQTLATTHEHFSFHPALSEPLPEDEWHGPTGYIHEVLRNDYLATHPAPTAIEYYLCGPQAMIRSARAMLEELGVPATQIAFDEF